MRAWAAAMVVVLGCGTKEPAKAPPATGSVASGSAIDPWDAPAKPRPSGGITEARKGFKTKLVDDPNTDRTPAEKPPAPIQLVTYESAVGKLPAYLAGLPTDGKRHPAIVWITGGDCNSIGDVWSPRKPSNDQSAAQYRDAGIVTLYPSLRGGNDNPGRREGFYGEVDDVLAAAAFLAKQPGVDPEQVYLGGHSTGGTLALLVAAAAPAGRFRGVIAFGPVASPDQYGVPNEFSPFEMTDDEVELRAPGRWLATIKTPTFVVEGEHGNPLDLLRQLASAAPITFHVERAADHFSVLAPMNARLAKLVAGAWTTSPPKL